MSTTPNEFKLKILSLKDLCLVALERYMDGIVDMNPNVFIGMPQEIIRMLTDKINHTHPYGLDRSYSMYCQSGHKKTKIYCGKILNTDTCYGWPPYLEDAVYEGIYCGICKLLFCTDSIGDGCEHCQECNEFMCDTCNYSNFEREIPEVCLICETKSHNRKRLNDAKK